MNQTNLKNGEFTARLNGLNLWFKISGQGPPCILTTPGWGPSSELYFLSLTPLEDHLTMIYLDTRGSGRSQKPDRSSDYTLADFSADIEALRQHLGLQRAWIMGYSRGGIHALHYALHHPTACIGLLLLDPSAERDEYAATDAHTRMEQQRNEPWYERARQAFDRLPTTLCHHDAFRRNLRSGPAHITVPIFGKKFSYRYIIVTDIGFL